MPSTIRAVAAEGFEIKLFLFVLVDRSNCLWIAT
jgi:hypothetical protein